MGRTADVASAGSLTCTSGRPSAPSSASLFLSYEAVNGSATRDESLQEQTGRLSGTDLFMICAVALSRKHKGNSQVEIQRDRSCQFRSLPLHGPGFLSLPVSLMERHRGQRLLSPVVLLNQREGVKLWALRERDVLLTWIPQQNLLLDGCHHDGLCLARISSISFYQAPHLLGLREAAG